VAARRGQEGSGLQLLASKLVQQAAAAISGRVAVVAVSDFVVSRRRTG